MNNVIYDYLTFSTQMHSTSAIVDILGLNNIQFEQLNGFYGYVDRLYFEGIHIHYNGREGMGICVEMSGKGCRTWEEYGTGDYDGIFSLILQNYSNDKTERMMNITRLDVAYDDVDGLLDLPLLIRETQLLNFISRFKDWQVIAGNKGCSVNHGSQKSNVYIRIYDKKQEQERQDLEHWVRCEIQMRKECALGFIQLESDVIKNYFDTLNNYLRYVIPNENESHKDRLITAPYWLKFIESYENKSIFAKPARDYKLNDLYGYVMNQQGGAIKTLISVVGVDEFVRSIYETQKDKSLNPKYKRIKAEHGKDGADGILDFLKERNAL